MGVQLINLGKRDAVVGIARNAEAEDDPAVAAAVAAGGQDQQDQHDTSAEGVVPAAGEPEE
jgi:DNA gyrase subunit A